MLLDRKKQHLDIVLSGAAHVGSRASGFDGVRFEHVALPEIDLDEIDIATTFLGRSLKTPFLVSSMTGGPGEAARINHNLAIACQASGVALAVGSQRVALESDGSAGLDQQLRRLAPDIPILANIGAAQLNTGFGLDEARRAVEMIEADALIIHLNPLQEALQPEGDRNWAGIAAKIGMLCRKLDVPVVAKEVGFGISASVARQLSKQGVRIIDVAGAGGTSWSAIEAERARTPLQSAIAAVFADWGQTTARAIAMVRAELPEVTIIGSGGIRHGLDAAKAIRLGADLVGQAAAVLEPAMRSPEAVADHFRVMAEQLRVACFCTGSADLKQLRSARIEAVAEFREA